MKKKLPEETWRQYICFAEIGLLCAKKSQKMDDAIEYLRHAAMHIELSAKEMKKNFEMKIDL